jgi:elongation factor P--beta-lysine ligase
MALFSYSDTARLDVAACIASIRQYFEERDMIELSEKHVLTFKAEMEANGR